MNYLGDCLPSRGACCLNGDLLSARPGEYRSPRALLRQWACVTSDSRPLIRIDGAPVDSILVENKRRELAACETLGSTERDRAGLCLRLASLAGASRLC
jgi:hypothetical protein